MTNPAMLAAAIIYAVFMAVALLLARAVFRSLSRRRNRRALKDPHRESRLVAYNARIHRTGEHPTMDYEDGVPEGYSGEAA